MKKSVFTFCFTILLSAFTSTLAFSKDADSIPSFEFTGGGIKIEAEDMLLESGGKVLPQKEKLEENLHPIDKAERDCIAKLDSTQAMNECAYKAMDAWYKEIDKYINLLKDVTSKDEYNNILEAQTQWKKYQEAEFKAVSILINKQGTIYQNILVGEDCGLIKQRAKDLKILYNYLIKE